MANTVLGKVSCTPKGDYNEATAYVVLDIVAHDGGSYMALQSVQGVTPSNDGVNWMRLAAPGEKGDKGDTGDTGPQGAKGDTGEKGDKGDTGDTGPQGVPGAAAGFGTPTATVDDSTGTPDVEVTASGPDTAKVFSFTFTGLKGETGQTGSPGPKGDPGTSVARIERTSGTGAAGTTDTYTMYDSDDEAIGTFTVYNGSNGTGSGDFMANGTVPMTGALQMGGNKVTGMADPTADTDGATKGYVDEAVAGAEVTTDATPTQGSTNPVQSGGVYTALQAVEDNIPTNVSELNNDSGYLTAESDPTVPAWAKADSKPTYTAEEVGAIPATQKGASGGVAELDSSGKVPTAQLPSYVDDVLEYDSLSAFPETGEDGKIYVDEDTNLTYRWSGTQYVEISPSLALGETSSTAYRGDRGKTAYDHSQTTGNPHNTTAADVGARPDTWMPSASDVGALPDTTSIPSALSDLTDDTTHRTVTDTEKTTWSGKADKPSLTTATLTTSGWSSNSQTVTVTGVLADSSKQAIDVVPANKASADAWAAAGVWCTGQGANSLTFTCESVPTAAISLNIRMQGV